MSTFNENDIRPSELVAGKTDAAQHDLELFVSRLTEFETADCPACDAKGGRLKWQKNGLDYRECEACGTVFMTPRPKADHLADYYERSEGYRYWAEVIFPASEAVRREKIVEPRMERIRQLCDRYQIARDLLLEVGAGFGTFCEVARDSGVFRRVVAVEPTPSLAAACRARGLEVIEAPIEKVSLEAESADVIASFEVLEHLLVPKEFIRRCAGFLRPGGMLVLSCPNGRGFDVEVMKEASDTIDMEHLNYFNPASIAMLAERHGFDVLEVSTPGMLDADLVRNKVLSGVFDLDPQPFLKQVLLERWDDLGAPFQEFLRSQQLSSHMWLVARKR